MVMDALINNRHHSMVDRNYTKLFASLHLVRLSPQFDLDRSITALNKSFGNDLLFTAAATVIRSEIGTCAEPEFRLFDE